MAPEGTLYGASLGSVVNQLLALQTAGFNNTNYTGPQCKLTGSAVWDRFCDGWLHTLTPRTDLIESYLAPAYQMFGYGDTLRLYAAPDFSAPYSSLMMLDYQTGNTNRLAKTTWLAVEAPEGGYEALVQRAGTSWGANEAYEQGILYFLTLDPATLAPPADPRPGEPLVFQDAKQGTLIGVTDWTTNRSVLDWRCSWISINHQNGDAGMFQFLRKGEFLTAELTGYDANDYGQASWLHNTLALQNTCVNGTPQNLEWYEGGLWATGSQWQLGEGTGDPRSLASAGAGYIFTYGDMTPLYNRPSPYTPDNACLDILQATRSLLWLQPDHILVYDRAESRRRCRWFRVWRAGEHFLARRCRAGSSFSSARCFRPMRRWESIRSQTRSRRWRRGSPRTTGWWWRTRTTRPRYGSCMCCRGRTPGRARAPLCMCRAWRGTRLRGRSWPG